MRAIVSVVAIGSFALGLGLSESSAQGADAAYEVPAATPTHIRRAVESNARSAEQRARDAGRKPAQVLTLAEIGEGAHVIELGAFGHYYSTLLVEAVGRNGEVAMVDMPWTEPFGGEAARAFAAEHSNATYTQAHYNQMSLPQNSDAAMSVLFYHDLTRDDVDIADMNARIFAALKPGGTYLVIDHRAEDGSGWRDAETLHRIDADAIRDGVTAAGFVLVHDSPLLTNPNDDRTLNMRAPEIRGSTDRAVLLFRKPVR